MNEPVKDFCILISIYKKYDKEKDALQLINLRRLNEIVKNKGYDVVCLTYSDEMYEYVANEFDMFNKSYIVDEATFKNVATYSLFFSTVNIWKELEKRYKYVYIVQDDVYVFNDQFKYWVDYCERYNISYCGGPIVTMNASWGITQKNPKPMVGNGGFSLRRLSTMSKLLSQEVWDHYNISRENVVDILMNKAKVGDQEKSWSIMEDVWYCVYLHNRYDFNILSTNKAYHFSWDMNPDIIIAQIFNKYNLPKSLIQKGVDSEEYKTFTSIVRTSEFIEDFKKFNLFAAHAVIKNIDTWGNIIPEYKEIYDKNPKYIEDLVEHYKINKFITGKMTYNLDKNK